MYRVSKIVKFLFSFIPLSAPNSPDISFYISEVTDTIITPLSSGGPFVPYSIEFHPPFQLCLNQLELVYPLDSEYPSCIRTSNAFEFPCSPC